MSSASCRTIYHVPIRVHLYVHYVITCDGTSEHSRDERMNNDNVRTRESQVGPGARIPAKTQLRGTTYT